MQNIKEQADMATAIAINTGCTFSEGVKQARVLIAAREAFIEAFMPEIGKTVKCTNNSVVNPGFEECLQLKVGGEYVVTGEDSNGLVFVEDKKTGQKIGHPFHKIRFEAVIDEMPETVK